MAGFALKVKSKSGQQVIKHLNPQSTVAELKSVLSSLTDVHLRNLHVLFGFPPKAMDLSGDNRTLVDVGISSGDTLIVDEKAPTEKPNSSPSSVNNEIDSFASKGILMKKVVPSDNSCLFTSIGFVLNGKVDTTVGTFMRQIIAEVVAGDTTNYSEAFLGKPNPEYCEWIKKPNSWGGAIEVSVLSRFYGLEMDVVDTLNAIINRFGEDQDYGQRVFLLFDGIHYDPLFLENTEGVIKTLFPIEDLDIYNEAEQLARDMKSSRSNTITYNNYCT